LIAAFECFGKDTGKSLEINIPVDDIRIKQLME